MSTITNEDLERSAVYQSAEERAVLGGHFQRLQELSLIHAYYFARGEWHVTTLSSKHIVLSPSQAPAWLSGFEERGRVNAG